MTHIKKQRDIPTKHFLLVNVEKDKVGGSYNRASASKEEDNYFNNKVIYKTLEKEFKFGTIMIILVTKIINNTIIK